ncbi:MAG TPA: GDYXXLXY domain-containing protein [Planctomycetota bacterium]|nr:GDYXXLXY domain-containing protein [Planctomycetota bacterium]
MMRWKLAVAWVALQVLFFVGWAATEQRRQVTGMSILVRTAPVDPRDLLRGQYMALSYEFSRLQSFTDAGRSPEEGEDVWIVLRPDGEYHTPTPQVTSERPVPVPPGHVAVLGRRQGWRLLFGVEEYFVQEGTETPPQKDTTVRLRVGKDGRLRIESVLVQGRPWP